MFRIFFALIILGCLGSIYHTHFVKEKIMLIPRKVLFENPDFTCVRLSPDGKWLSYLAPKDGVLNVWVKNLTTGKIKTITEEKKRSLRAYAWAYDNEHILYVQDKDGDENWELYKTQVQTGITTLLTHEKGVHTKIIGTSHLHPNHILIGLNHRNPAYHDVYKVNIKTGQKTLVLENNEFANFLTDDNLNIILAVKTNPKGEALYYRPDGKDNWKLYRTVALEDVSFTSPLITDLSQEWMYWLDSEGSDKSNLVKMHLKTKERITLAKGTRADISDVLIHPLTKEIWAINEEYLRETIMPFTKDMTEDLKILKAVDEGDVKIAGFTLDYTKWIVVFSDDHQPMRYYIYDRVTKKAQFLFHNKNEWIGLPFVKMHLLEIKARDGLTMTSYLSKPVNCKSSTPAPMVLFVHGGPNGRDEWGLNPIHQWLANRGYAVLSVNFRGSTGFGKSFFKAGFGEWGRKMHDDLIDAVNWAIQERIADPKKIAIFGGSYGGYAALVGVTMTPDVFACAVDIVGPSNLVTLLNSLPAYWNFEAEQIKKWVGGDPKTEQGKVFLKSRSPLTYIDNIKKPLFIAQGANDPRVKKAESDQIANAMIRKKIPVTYVLFPDEGHGFVRSDNRLAYMAVTEIFLKQNLGGLVEPMKDELKKSSMQVIGGKIN